MASSNVARKLDVSGMGISENISFSNVIDQDIVLDSVQPIENPILIVHENIRVDVNINLFDNGDNQTINDDEGSTKFKLVPKVNDEFGAKNWNDIQ